MSTYMKKKLFLRTTVMSTQKEEIKTNFMDQSFLSALNLNQEDREEPEKRKEKILGFGLWFYYKGKL